jgi:hypothetical protein
MESFVISDEDNALELQALSFEGEMNPSGYGFSVGDTQIELDSLIFGAGQPGAFAVGPIAFGSASSVNDGRLDTSVQLVARVGNFPGYGDIGVTTSVELEGADAAALGRILAVTETLPARTDPTAAMPLVEHELMDLLAAGFHLRIDNLDISLPDGMVRSMITLNVEETDRDAFTWTSLLLSTDAEASLEVPEPIANMAMLLSPQASVVEGFLIKQGDVYVMDLAYKKGVLSVNGAPIPVPLQ